MRNPYADAHWRIRVHERSGPRWLLPLVAAALAAPLARPVLLAFLDGPASDSVIAAGTDAIAFRMGALVAAAMSLHTYTDLVRGPDRDVLDVHPVHPRLLLQAIALRTARQRLYLPAMAAIVMAPLALANHVDAWLGCLGVIVGAYLSSLGVGFSVHLAAVWVAFSPRLARLLDLLRGDNPRMQAALIYAPGAVLAIEGLVLGIASAGVSAGLQGWSPGWAFLLLPLALGLVGAAVAGPLAEHGYVRASALLAEIDAAWGGVDDAAEDGHVYLEWLARRRPELLRALRQGWRRTRSWPMAAWGLGGVGLFAGWSADPGAPTALVAVAGAAVVLISAVPTRLAQGDPPWLDAALGVAPGRVFWVRALVGLLYAQGAILPPILALFIRQGGAALLPLLILQGLACFCSLFASLFAWRMRGRGAWLYAPLAVLVWALVVSLAAR